MYNIILLYDSIIDHRRHHLISSRGTRAHHRESAATTISLCVSLCPEFLLLSPIGGKHTPPNMGIGTVGWLRFLKSICLAVFPERSFPMMILQ